MTRTSPNAITAPLRITRHRILCKVHGDSVSEQRDFQHELRVAIIPQTKTDFPSVIVDREIAWMGNEVENPVRENCETNDEYC
jgi:hypothetical protein